MTALRPLILLALCATLLAATGAHAYDWTYLSMNGENCTCVVNDPLHDRIFVGTVEGFHYLEQSTGVWTSRDWDGWIGRQVWSIDYHRLLDQRVITGRENAFFKGYIEYSDDLGASETIAYNSDGGSVTDLDHNPAYHFACTWSDISPGEFLRSADGGETWTLLSGHGHYVMTSLAVGALDEIYLAGDNRVMRSWDNGDTWDSVGGNLSPAYGIYCVEYAHPGGDIMPEISLVASNDLGLYFSDVVGVWNQILDTACRKVAPYPGADLWPPPPWHIAAVTFDGRVMVSTNCGGSWSDETGDLPGTPVDVAYSPYDDGLYVCTANNGVYFVADVVTGAPDGPAAPAEVALSAWPNPFNPQTRLRFTLPEAGRAELAVFDVGGRRVATLLDGRRDAGANSLSWNAEGFASGVYLARLSGDFETRTLRLVLLK